ncbi:MAG: membrane protein insertion efficiency factor YidD [Cyanobacteriota bacterium]|nr:membrane protein insertion efficiency factor YidD [Cyanobacteriota bacterium]
MQQSNGKSIPRSSRIFDRLAVSAIGGYQRYLSPYKGFSCAHRVLHGGQSCSQYVKCQIRDVGFLEATVMARQRFAACREAKQILQMRVGRHRITNTQANRKRRWSNNSCQNGCNYVDCSGCPVDCGDFDLPEFDCGECGNFGECGGGIDCCSGGDCGSCG